MQNLKRFAAAVITATLFSACGGGGSTLSGASSPVFQPAVPDFATSGPSNADSVSLATDTHSTCVRAQKTAQRVTLPATGGVTATLDFASYDVGGTDCQNVTIATGAAATQQQFVFQSTAHTRQTKAAGAPILAITMGEGFPSSLGLATAVSGARFQVDSNVNFPDGTYNALVTYSILGAPVTLSLQFTATGGVLTVANANVFPFQVPGGARLALYDRGVVPVGFTLPTATPTPNISATPATTPTPAVTTIPGSYGSPPPETIGYATYSLGIDCPGGFYPGGGPLCTNTVPLQINGSGNYRLPGLPGGQAGTISYTVDKFQALSYYVEGCKFPIQYSGGGLQGTFTLPNSADFPNGQTGPCYIHLSSVPAGINGTGSGATIELYFGTSAEFPSMSLPVTPVTPSPAPMPT